MRLSVRALTMIGFAVTFILVGVVLAAPPQQANLLQLFQLNVRLDQEVLADDVFGVSVRPAAWTGNQDLDATNFLADLFFDNEQLADEVFGPGERPDNWIGATSRDPEIVSGNIRHDLELIATDFYSARSRPDDWEGAPPVFQCSRSLQNLIRFLDTFYDTRPTTAASVVDYCTVVKNEIDDELFEVILSGSDVQEEVPQLISGLRGDLERLADELLGLETRPTNWIGNRVEESPTFISDVFIDQEALADDQLGVDTRPDAWVNATPSGSPAGAYQNLRFNLELLADLTLGENVRPNGWQGVDPLSRCEPTLQSLTIVVEQNFGIVPLPSVSENSAEFCKQFELAVNDLAENPPIEEEVIEEITETRFIAQSRYAFAYLDVAALQYMGAMPYDTEFRAWYRNFNESNMMFVSGDEFALYIDRRWTTMEDEVFATLPLLDDRKPLTFCDAGWCNGPGPTPTPTGSGPLVAIFEQATPAPTPDPQELEETGKILVSWNNIRVGYLLDRPEANSVQVTLEICASSAQIACEPVISVFDGNTNTFLPVIQQFNGLNVFEFQYGYITNLIIEGATRYSRDVWISDPTIR